MPDNLDINFVTANERRRIPDDNRRKAFDAFGDNTRRLAGFYSPFPVNVTRTFTEADLFPETEPSGDVRTDNAPGTISTEQLEQLDITDFAIQVVRG